MVPSLEPLRVNAQYGMEWMYSVNCSVLRVASRGEGIMETSLRGRGGV